MNEVSLFNQNQVSANDAQSQSVQVFNCELGEVRVIIENGEPLFCASDVCKALEYSNGRDAIARHCDNEDVVKYDTPTNSGIQLMSYLNESGLYSLIMSSKNDKAKEFKRWVTKEVLPSIKGKKVVLATEAKTLSECGNSKMEFSNEITITSLEIAELTGKEHIHVKRDIKEILGKVRDVSKFGYIYLDSMNRQQQAYRLPKIEALTLISGYRVDIRIKIIERLDYLENEFRKTQLPAPMTLKESLLLNLQLVEENEKLQAEALENAPKVKAFNELMQSKDAIDFLTFSKVIGIGRTKLFARLRELEILRVDNTPFQRYVDAGYFRVVESSYTQNDVRRIYCKTMILPKGQKFLTNKLKG